ncbi:PAS domain S-box protein [Fulvivirga ulvae]|uniref:sensor histidine kinase n=1 Tax=Fulvivirga ulvae TaxID=2904245 RepID=UPI001F17EDAF|nr:sensor histidine kinase [Fulvivirga ulvae]UII32251.1 PAS domain S-box protein [Fulvivirga ulvae]
MKQLNLGSDVGFMAIFEKVAVAMSITDMHGKWLHLNSVFTKMLGYTREELLQKDFRQITHPEERSDDIGIVKKIISGEVDEFTKEKRYLHKSGSVVWGKVHLSVIKDKQGRAQNIIATIEDITARKQAEKALKESEQRFRMLADNIPNLCWVADREGWIYWYNSQWYEYTGTTPEQMEGWGWQSVHDPEILPVVVEKWKTSLQNVVPFEMVFPIKGADGEFRPFLTRVVPVQTGEEATLQWFGTNTEITALRNVEAKLQYQNSLLKALQEVSPLGILVVAPSGKMEVFNQMFAWMWKFPAEIMDTQLDAFALQTAREQLIDSENFIKKVLQCYKNREINQEKLYFKDGRIFYRHGSPINGDGGRNYGYVWFFQDITEQENLVKQKDEFIGIASHELKTPLTGVKAIVQLMEHLIQSGSYDQLNKLVGKANLQVNKLSTLINDLLDVSKIQFGKIEYSFTAFKISEVIEDSVEQALIHSSKHKIKVEGNTNITIFGDKIRLEQVMTNLLSNAVKYSPDANEVVISVLRLRGELEVAVRDFGIGISKEEATQLFSRFYRSRNLTNQFKGIGLGLYISYEIIKRHNGKIWAESEGAGKGSVFKFRLPLHS